MEGILIIICIVLFGWSVITTVYCSWIEKKLISFINESREIFNNHFEHINNLSFIISEKKASKAPDFSGVLDKAMEILKASTQSETDSILENNNKDERLKELENENEQLQKRIDDLLDSLNERNAAFNDLYSVIESLKFICKDESVLDSRSVILKRIYEYQNPKH